MKMGFVDSQQERIHRLPYLQYALSLAALLACILLQSDLDGDTLDTPCQKQGNAVCPRHAALGPFKCYVTQMGVEGGV